MLFVKTMHSKLMKYMLTQEARVQAEAIRRNQKRQQDYENHFVQSGREG